MDNRRKADGEHPEREDGKWMRTDGNKRKTVDVEEGQRAQANLEVPEAEKESEETQEVVELAEVEVNEDEEVECRTEGETQFED